MEEVDKFFHHHIVIPKCWDKFFDKVPIFFPLSVIKEFILKCEKARIFTSCKW